jgi:uncharacterized protein with PQ loop repeat
MVELFGYFSMILVLVSMLMKDMWMLRLLNSVACSCFVVYGYMIGSFPVIIMNILVIFINIYKMKK